MIVFVCNGVKVTLAEPSFGPFCDAMTVDLSVSGGRFYSCAERAGHAPATPHRHNKLIWTDGDPTPRRIP